MWLNIQAGIKSQTILVNGAPHIISPTYQVWRPDT